jgi:hypothetical protein
VLDDPARAIGILEKRRARARLRDLPDGATEVDVDKVGARRLHHAGSLGHDPSLGAEDLDGQGMLVHPDPEVAESSLVSVGKARAADHLGADQPGPETASLAPEGLHAHPGHGGEHKAGRNLYRTDAPGRVQIDRH